MDDLALGYKIGRTEESYLAVQRANDAARGNAAAWMVVAAVGVALHVGPLLFGTGSWADPVGVAIWTALGSYKWASWRRLLRRREAAKRAHAEYVNSPHIREVYDVVDPLVLLQTDADTLERESTDG